MTDRDTKPALNRTEMLNLMRSKFRLALIYAGTGRLDLAIISLTDLVEILTRIQAAGGPGGDR